jgi:hypothetical protein
MQWHKVELRGADLQDLQAKSGALAERFGLHQFAARFPEGAHVYLHAPGVLDHVYFFSPIAAEWLMARPAWGAAIPCDEPADLASLKKLEF